jgi:hypothetical protein
MGKTNRSYEEPHYDLERVHMAVALRRVHFTRKAQEEARALLPPGTIKVSAEIAAVVGSLEREAFAFCERRAGEWVDVYRVARTGFAIWVKIKLETSPDTGEEVIVISFHRWDEARPV